VAGVRKDEAADVRQERSKILGDGCSHVELAANGERRNDGRALSSFGIGRDARWERAYEFEAGPHPFRRAIGPEVDVDIAIGDRIRPAAKLR